MPGKRGRPKGTGGFDKERARQRLRELVWQQMDAMVQAQVEHAKGVKFLMVREKNGTFRRFTGKPEDLRPQETIIEVWSKDPSTQAFTDLLNRTIDKPADTMAVQGDITLNLKGEIMARLHSGRQRVAEAARGKRS